MIDLRADYLADGLLKESLSFPFAFGTRSLFLTPIELNLIPARAEEADASAGLQEGLGHRRRRGVGPGAQKMEVGAGGMGRGVGRAHWARGRIRGKGRQSLPGRARGGTQP